MSRDSLIVSSHLGEFFHAEVNDARGNLGIEMPKELEHYVVNLLVDYGRSGRSLEPGAEPLALIYKRALDADLAERVRLLKSLGDLALYVSGFFVEFIERSLVDVDYYVGMGGSAYSSASDLVASQPHGDSFGEIFNQLAAKFTDMVDLLNEIAERARDNTEDNQALLRMYDRWTRTGSDRIRRMLLDRGLVPADGLPTEYVQ